MKMMFLLSCWNRNIYGRHPILFPNMLLILNMKQVCLKSSFLNSNSCHPRFLHKVANIVNLSIVYVGGCVHTGLQVQEARWNWYRWRGENVCYWINVLKAFPRTLLHNTATDDDSYLVLITIYLSFVKLSFPWKKSCTYGHFPLEKYGTSCTSEY